MSKPTNPASTASLPSPSPIRDRVQELRRVRASELADNCKNWRVHPEHQRAALRGLLSDIGFAGASGAWPSRPW